MGVRGDTFVLVHSPSVGPSTWEPVAERLRAAGHDAVVPSLLDVGRLGPPFWPVVAARVAARVPQTGPPVGVVLHSNAGLFAPHIAAAIPGRVGALIFVDASIPPAEGDADVVPPKFLEQLRAKARGGVLPRWTDWWTEEDLAPLFPDAQTRRRVTEEQPLLPLAYYEETIPVEPGWTRIPCAYLLFGPPYEELADEARELGWPVVRVAGEHLHMLVDPPSVADALVALRARLGETVADGAARAE